MHARHGRKRPSLTSPVQSAAIRSFPAVTVHTQSPQQCRPGSPRASPATNVTLLLSLSRVSSVSAASKQLPPFGPSYGRKRKKTGTFTHKLQAYTLPQLHTRKEEVDEVKKDAQGCHIAREEQTSSRPCGWEFPKLAAP